MIDETRPHVVMMVANDVTVDTRVRKMANDLASAGPRVTVLGLSNTAQREVAKLGKATIIRLPVSKLLRTVAHSTAFPGRSRRYELIHRIQSQRERFKIHQREVGAKIGWLHRNYFAARSRRLADENKREMRRQNNLERRNQVLLSLIETAKTWTARFLSGAVIRGCWLLIKADRRFGSLVKKTRNRSFWYREQMRLKRMQATESRMRKKLAKEHAAYEKRVQRMQAQLAQSAATDKRRLFRRADWRDELPELHDYESVFGPALDELAPDVVHAHDVHLLGVGARAVGRAIVGGKHPILVYDAHEYVQGLSRYSNQELAAWSSLEKEYIGHADQIITVSKPLAELLRDDYGLDDLPTVIMNIPVDGNGGTDQVRSAAGVSDGTPLVVYSGGLDPTRGIHTLVEAIGKLEGVHLALVSKVDTNYVRTLRGMAEEGGYESRIHVVPFVAPQDVVSYLRSATVAVHPMISGPMNHEIALPNKIFEYMHAQLPIVVSSCRAMSELVTELDIGEVFQSENSDSLAESVRRVLENIDHYHDAYRRHPDLLERYSWTAQREKMFEVYRDILGEAKVTSPTEIPELPSDAPATTQSIRLAVGPMNMAGQAWEWAKAVERNLPIADTEVFEITRAGRLVFPADVRIEGASWRSLDWQLEWVRHIGSSFSHTLLESGHGALGRLNGGRLVDDVPFLRERGIEVGAVFHGSEIRDPRRHRQLVDSSPFRIDDPDTQRLIVTTEANLIMLEEFDGPVFVSTLDLLDYVPHATWLPQVISLERWQAQPFEPSTPLKVLFAPTAFHLKGGEHIEEIGGRLHDEGIIDLRVERRRIPPKDMPNVISQCDVLIDGLVLGLYGTTSVEGMASGRLVLANLSRVLDRQPEEPPIVHVTPYDLEAILRKIAADPEAYREQAESGPDYVETYHDGRYSAGQLSPFLGLSPAPTSNGVDTHLETAN